MMFRAWIIWLLSALFMSYKYALEVSPSVMTGDLMREFSLSGVQMGHLAACYFYAYLILQIPAGLLIDRWGPRRVTTVAMILCAVGTYIFSTSGSFTFACLGRFLTGIGASFAAINCLKLVANWFPSNRFAFMAGLMMTVGMLGAVGGQAPLSAFISYLGWREAMSVLALAGLVIAGLFVWIVRDESPDQLEIAQIEKPAVLANLKSVLRNPQSWFLSLYSGFAFAPVSAFGGLWGVPFLSQAFGFSTDAAAQGSSLIFLGFALGAPVFGWFSDRIGDRKNVMLWGTITACVCLAAVLYLPLPSFVVFSTLFLFGFSISSFLLCFTMIKEMHCATLAATSVGFMNAFDALFGAFSDPLTGKVLDYCWTGTMVDGVRIFSLSAYHYALFILIVYLGASLLFLRKVRDHRQESLLSSS